LTKHKNSAYNYGKDYLAANPIRAHLYAHLLCKYAYLRALSEGQGSAFANRYAVYEKGKTVAIYHCSIKIISRGKGRSAVACAAYRSGTKLTDLATGKIFDYSNKSGVVFSEVLLPENAPTIFAVDRNILWDAVERKETHSAAQLAREVEVALPCEFTRQEQIDTVREYIMKNFVREGMCADWALHDKGDGNPHAHIMLTMRAIKPNGRWAEKSRTIYKLDPNGQKIPVIDPTTGQQKIGARGRKMWQRETVPANDWNDHSKAEKWRAAWAAECNRRLDRQHQIDHRSYARQAIEQEPTIHEGYAARKMEREGRVSDRCEINRETKALNEQNSRSLELEIANGELYNATSERLRLYRDVIRDLESESKELSGAIQQAEDAEMMLAAPVERCKPWERAKRKEQAEQRENALQKRTEAFAALYELGCATIEAAKSLLQSILQRIRQLRQEQAELRADLERLGEELPVVKHAADLLQPAASTEQISVRERLQAIRQQREAERKAHAEWVEQQRRANMQREQPERSPQEPPDDAAAQQEQKVRSVADYAAKYRAQNKNNAPKHHRGRSR
jgi:hypothetical protein